MAYCANCRNRVEDGAVRCASCGSQLDRPGAFLQVLGWVTVAVSAIPLAISEVTTAELNLVPLATGAVILFAGIAMVVTGKFLTRLSPPTVLEDVGEDHQLLP